MDLNGAGVTTVAEWFNFRVKHIIAEATTLTTHLILDHGNDEEFKAFANATLETDTNKDDLHDFVYRNSFSRLNKTDALVPKLYEYAPFDEELYETEDEEEQAGRRMFDFMVMQGMDVTNVNEWLTFFVKHAITKAATATTNPFLNTGTMEESKAFADANNFRQRLLPQRGGRQGLPPQHGDYKVLNLIDINKYSVPDDVSPHMAPAGNDGRVRGSLYAQADIPGPEEERGRTSGSLPNEADVPRPEEERGRNDDPLRVAEMGSPGYSSGCQKTRSKGLEEMMGGEGEKRK